MTKFTNPLNNLKVASPCEESWENMLGNERRRYCGKCRLNVYNLSGMTRAEAEELVGGAEGRLCVRFYQRADGSVITQDCPVGWAKIKNRAKVLTTAAFSLILTLFSGILFASFFGKSKGFAKKLPVVFSTPEPLMGEVEKYPLMGKVTASTPMPERYETVGVVAQPIKKETKRRVLAENN